MTDLSISIVSYNTAKLLARCITSIYKHSRGLKIEIIVVDNASRDNSVALVKKKFPRVHLIENKKNEFFTRANNKALKNAQGKYFLILNSDTYFVGNSLLKIKNYMDAHLDVGVIEGLELYENNEVIPTGSRFSTPLIDFYELSWFGRKVKNKRKTASYRMRNKNRKDTYEIDVACDAFLCIRREVFKRIDGYDERFKLYYTENDLCLRVKQLGYKIIHFGKAKVIHTVSSSVKKIGWKKMDIYYDDLYLYYRKYNYIVSGFALFTLLKFEEALLKALKPKLQ